jgi:hypothetical protein
MKNNILKNIYDFFSRLFEKLSLKLKPKKIEDENEEEDWTNLIISNEILERY